MPIDLTTYSEDGPLSVAQMDGNWAAIQALVNSIESRLDDAEDRLGAHLLDTYTAAAAASIDFALPAGYDDYQIIVDCIGSTSASLQLRVSRDGGSNYDAGASDYAVSANGGASSNTAQVQLTTASSGVAQYVVADIIRPASTTKQCGILACCGSHAVAGRFVTATRASTDAVDAIRLMMSTGTITGRVKLFGVRNNA